MISRLNLKEELVKPIHELVQQIRAAGKEPDFYGPQSADSVDRLGSLLGVKLPPSYRDFLMRYGGGYGLIGLYRDQPELRELGCLVGDTERMREVYNLPPQFLPVEESTLGGIYCLDASSPDPDGEYPVILITIGPGRQLTHRLRVANSFGEYLQDLLEGRLEVLLEEQEEAQDS
jgi:cell wall assembly regulator SMI1